MGGLSRQALMANVQLYGTQVMPGDHRSRVPR